MNIAYFSTSKVSTFWTIDVNLRHQLFVFFILILLPFMAFTNPQCEDFYTAKPKRLLAPAIGGANFERIVPANRLWSPTLFHPKYQPTGLTYNSRETRFIDQEMSLECPAFAFVNALENAYANHPKHPKQVAFDPTFLIGAKLHRYLEKALDPESNFKDETDPYQPTREGGEFHNYLDIALTYGLVPAETWRPLMPLGAWPFHREKPHDLPFLYKKLRDTVDQFNDSIWNNQIQRVDKADPQYLKWKQQQVDRIFKEVLGSHFGNWPFPFTHEGRSNLTPKSYSQVAGPSRKNVPELIYMSYYPYIQNHWTNRLYPFFNETFPNSKKLFTHKQFEPERFYETISKGLAEGKGIVLDTDGSIDGNGHSFAVTDIEVQNGKIVAVRLKNAYRNWPNGYAWFSVEELNKHIRRAWLFEVQ